MIVLPRGAANRKFVETELFFATVAPKCFAPNAVFKKVDGGYITASNLKGHGGDILVGPNNTCVQVMSTKRHLAQQRTFLKIHTSSSTLEVTHDHRVLVQSSQGFPITVTASQMIPDIITGVGPQPVRSFDVDHRVSEVVEPIFEKDAPVLVWTRNGRRQKSAELEHAFAVRGGLCDVHTFLGIKNGFYDGLRTPGDLVTSRSRSADSSLSSHDRRRLARARSSWLQPTGVVQDMAD